MKVRMMIGGVREVERSDPGEACGVWLETVAFPMEVTNYGYEGGDDPDTLTLHSEEELKAWAERAFPDGYEILDVEVPASAVSDPEHHEQLRRRELAEALVSLSTAYDDPHGTVLEALDEARTVIRMAWRDGDVCADEFALAHGKLDALVRTARRQRT